MNFYQQNKHLFDDDNQATTGPATRISQLDQFLSKPRPVPNFPKFTYYEKEPLQLQPQPQSEAPKNVFSQNARNLLGNNYNDKYEALYDRNSYTGRKEFENRPYDLPGPYNQPNSADNNMKNFISPLKASYNQSAGSKVDSLTNLDRYNIPSSYDQNQNIGSGSFSKQGTREQYAQENRQIDNSYGYGAKSFGRNIPNDPYKRIEGLPPLPENRGGNINNPDRYAQNKPNYGIQQQQPQDRAPAWQNDNIRNNPVRSNISQQGPDSRNYLGDDSGRKENRYMPPQPQSQIQQNMSDRPSQGRVSHNESGRYGATRIKESQSMKITSKEVAGEEIKRDWRFPHDDYQAIKRKVGIRDLDTSDVSALQNVRPHMQANWQSRLSELNAIKGRRTLPEALERRSLNATNPERKNRLKALLRGE